MLLRLFRKEQEPTPSPTTGAGAGCAATVRQRFLDLEKQSLFLIFSLNLS